MIETSLIGQYVRLGWNSDDIQYQEIVAVYFYEGNLIALARNPDGRLNPYNLDGCIVTKTNES